MTRWLTGALLLCASAAAVACPLCIGALRHSPAQELTFLRQAVLAVPTADQRSYRVVEVIKGDRPPNGMIEEGSFRTDAAALGSGKPLLLARDASWPMWVNVGALSAKHASWLRQFAAGKPWTEMNADEWQARVAFMLPYLESPEPLVAEIVYGEIARAPYTVLLAVKSRLDAATIRRWLADPKLVARQPLYLLLLGIDGDARDATDLERRLEAAWQSRDATNLGSMLAADLELRGAARMAWIDEKYLRDRGRSTPELEAVLLALSVQGNANNVIPRERVIQSYRMFMREHKEIAGFVAQDLAAWQYWDAVPEYVALMKSDLRQQYASRLAIVAYLKQSPSGAAGVDFK
jgi:hypothetical protein